MALSFGERFAFHLRLKKLSGHALAKRIAPRTGQRPDTIASHLSKVLRGEMSPPLTRVHLWIEALELDEADRRVLHLAALSEHLPVWAAEFLDHAALAAEHGSEIRRLRSERDQLRRSLTECERQAGRSHLELQRLKTEVGELRTAAEALRERLGGMVRRTDAPAATGATPPGRVPGARR